MKKLRVLKKVETCEPGDNWTVAKDWFPEIDINQETGTIRVTSYETSGYQKKASITTEWVKATTKGDATFVRGEVYCKNFARYKCTGSQQFCFAIFVGDSGHIYTHRAPATKGWMNEKPENIRKRLRKLGIGVEKPAVQQGDFLLKKANGDAPGAEEFVHESMGAGHHKFTAPVLYCDKGGKRFYKLAESTMLYHHAVDGIRHPDVLVKPGVYIVGTTATSLPHSNYRD
jgi:hypothetical protein